MEAGGAQPEVLKDKESQPQLEASKGRTRERLLLALKVFLASMLIFAAGAGAGYLYFEKINLRQVLPAATQRNTHIEFLLEVYDKVAENYWEKMPEEHLVDLFGLGIERLTSEPQTSRLKTKGELELGLRKALKDLDAEKKKEFSVSLASLVLTNLKPFGRNGLYTTKDEKNLRDMVENVNPGKDLYTDLGVEKGASESAVREAFEEKTAELEKLKEASPEAKKALEKVEYAFNILSSPDKKERYDKFGAEPTVFAQLIRPKILHLYIKRFSSTTFDEFKKAADGFAVGESGALILDLRGNIGGSVDLLPYLLGPFIGQDQYAYEFFHQGETLPFKTRTGWLPSLARYKKVVVLVDGQTQSTAELMAAVLKRYNVGVIVGEKTKGWGTVEKVFKISSQISPGENLSVFLVHSLTLRDDNQPIEGMGVEPPISIKDPSWKEQLFAHFQYQELIEAVEEVWGRDPGKTN